jgi:hypothetical protein
MCSFSGNKKTIWPWTLVALLMIGMTATLEQETGNKDALSTQAAQIQEINSGFSQATAYLTHDTKLSPQISVRKTIYGVLGFPAFFLQDKPFPFLTDRIKKITIFSL